MRNLVLLFLLSVLQGCISGTEHRPNILFIIMDDQSWEHVGYLNNGGVRTPAIDNLAKTGIRFNHAYVAAPSCSPSRAGILTGQDIFRLEEAGVLTGFIREKFKLFPLLMEEQGYFIGNTGKPYWPRTPDVDGAYDEPIGRRYTNAKLDAPEGISKNDYPRNFEYFLDQKPENTPFFFWVGISEPHLPYKNGLGIDVGIDTSQIRVPAFYKDHQEIKLGLSEYQAEIEWGDKMLGRIMTILEQRGIAENTIVVFTSDNGMPFPRAKATLYDHGVRVPLIVKWPGEIGEDLQSDIPVSLIDLAPTFLDFSEIEVPSEMTGRSLDLILKGKEQDFERDYVVTAIEKHTQARPDSLGYPRRAIHTEEWVYIKNYEFDRYPAGDSSVFILNWDNYGDVDPSRIKTYFKNHSQDADFKRLFELSFGKTPEEELFNKKNDPDMVQNLAYNSEYESVLVELRGKLNNYLAKNKDPRAHGESPWDFYYLDY